MAESLVDRVRLAKNGNAEIREAIIAEQRDFVLGICSKICRRALDWRNDDELCVGLLALNEAIDGFDLGKGGSFDAYARVVIRRRLVDFFRKEGKERQNVFLDQGEEEGGPAPWEAAAAQDQYDREQEAADRAAQIAAYALELSAYGLTLGDLLEASPKHRDTRRSLLKAALTAAKEPAFLGHLKGKGELPLGALSQKCGLSRRVLERGRRYLVAMILILSSEEYPHLRTHLDICQEAEGR